MKQIVVSTPPPAPVDDLSDDDLLVITAAKPTPQGEFAVTTKNCAVINDMTHDVFVNAIAPDGSKRNRKEMKFWLDLRNPEDWQLAAWLFGLKAARRMQSAIRDALRLYRDLKAGQYGVFKNLFPDVYARILAENCTQASTKPTAENTLSAQLERLEMLLLEQGNMASTGSPKPLNVAKVPGPKVDDEEVKLNIKKAKSSGKASENFLKSAWAVAGIQ